MFSVYYLILGFLTGIIGSFVGLGGGFLLVPALVLIFGMEQHQAQGTSLASMLPPVGILAVLKYYSSGHVNLKIAGLICVGMFLGGYFGALFAEKIPELVLKRFFGLLLLATSVKMILGRS